MWTPRLTAVALALGLGLRGGAAPGDPLAAGFAAPPRDARPLVWWHWINGNVSKEGIEADLADMKRVGIAGVQMFDVSIYLPPGPIRYGTEPWHEHVQHAIATADKLGLEFHLMNTPGWSASGGPWVTPERSMKKLVWSETEARGGDTTVTTALAQPEIPPLKFRTPVPHLKENFYRDIAVLAVPADSTRRTPDWAFKTKLAERTLAAPPLDTDGEGCIPRAHVLDLTTAFDPTSSLLRTTLPAGRWTILRFGYTSTGSSNHPAPPEGHGLEIDKMDAAAVSFYFDRALGRILRDAGPRTGRTLKGLLFDSFEAGPQTWTDTFPDQFRTLKGYDFMPLLPVLTGRVIDNPSYTEAALRDFRSAVEELMARNYFGTMRRRAHEHGLVTYAEAQGGPLNPVTSNEHVDVPMNEFWLPDAEPRMPRLKLVASAANLLGRRIIAAESFTAKPEDGAWQAVPANLKSAGDYAWTAGINRFVLHHYVHQPVSDAAPGFGLGRYGTHFGRLNTWWPMADAWIAYVSRSQFLLQQGRTVADIAFLHNEDHGYAYPQTMVTTPAGYDFEICYPRHLESMAWRNGALVHPNGPEYRMLVLPANWAANLPTLRKLRALAREGAAIVGPAPAAPAGVRDFDTREEYLALVRELWDSGDQSLIRTGGSLATAIRDQGLAPDLECRAPGGNARVRHIHRRTDDADIYFVFNHSTEPVAGDFVFRIHDRRPELWDAVSGQRTDAPVFRRDGERMLVPLTLEPHGSRFVVFRRPLPARWVERVTPGSIAGSSRLLASPDTTVTLHASDGTIDLIEPAALPQPITIPGPWQVSFVHGRGAPSEVTFPSLLSWSEHGDPGIRFYSGIARYRATFVLPERDETNALAKAAVLDLGLVADLAEVHVNGTKVGVLWQPPFRTDITRHLRAGENTLEIHVANRWINRLIGDEGIPVDYTYQKSGTNKFTDGRLEVFPVWLHDRSRLAERKRVSFSIWKHYEVDSPLVPSGLLGPVRIEWRAVINP